MSLRAQYNQQTNPPDSFLIIELIEAFRRSKTMFTAVSLGVFDLLEGAPAELGSIAAALKVKSDALERLLDACVGLMLLRKNADLYENEPAASTYLCREHPQSLAGYILYSSEVLFPLWMHLDDAIRQGTPRWKQAFGTEGGIFDHFFRTEDTRRTFIQGMHGLGALSSPSVVRAFDLSRFRKLVDLGGATGHLAVAACEQYTNLQALVFDLPVVIEGVRAQVRRSAVSERIGLLAGDFFQDELPEADLFAMSRILHDWSEEKSSALLRKIYQRLPAGGCVLVAEKLLNEDKTGPTSAQMQSLNMLLCTEGKERSLGEYRKLLNDAGFENIRGSMTGSPLDAIVATKPM